MVAEIKNGGKSAVPLTEAELVEQDWLDEHARAFYETFDDEIAYIRELLGYPKQSGDQSDRNAAPKSGTHPEARHQRARAQTQAAAQETPSQYMRAQQSRLQLVRWDEIHMLPKRRWLIKNVLMMGGFSLLVGESGSFKSFLAMDIGVRVARAISWYGRNVKQGPVVYVAAEGGLGIVERLAAYEKHNAVNTAGIPFYVLPQQINLYSDDADVDDLGSEIKRRCPESASLIVLDTLNCVMPGGDENSPADMGAVLQNCRFVQKQTGAHVLLVHHLGKDSARGARGHSSLKAAVDTELTVRAKNGQITLKLTKQRDGRTGEQFFFHPLEVDLGADEDGEPLTSCVMEAVKADKADSAATLGKAAQVALKAIGAALAQHGIPAMGVPGIPQDIGHVVLIEHWRTAAYASGISAGEDRAKQKAFQQAVEQLKKRQFVGTTTTHAWLTGQANG